MPTRVMLIRDSKGGGRKKLVVTDKMKMDTFT